MDDRLGAAAHCGRTEASAIQLGGLAGNGWEAGIRTPIRRSRVLFWLKKIKQINNLARQIWEKSGKIRTTPATKRRPKSSFQILGIRRPLSLILKICEIA